MGATDWTGMKRRYPVASQGATLISNEMADRRVLSVRLSALNVLRFQPFLTRNEFEGDQFPFIQSPESPTQDGRVMHKNVQPRILGDKAKPFFVIEPLNFTTCHMISPEGCQPTPTPKMVVASMQYQRFNGDLGVGNSSDNKINSDEVKPLF
jgi:hypothetical protein